MSSVFDKLNLRPAERRLIVIAALVLFVVINIWQVVPKFKEWQSHVTKLQENERLAAKYAAETNQLPVYYQRLGELQSAGEFISFADAGLSLMQAVATKAAECNVTITRQTPGGGGDVPNNPFYTEQRVTMGFVSDETNLVNFLVRLGEDKSLMRVRDIDLKPDPKNEKLVGSITVIGRYQKKPTPKTPGLKTSAKPAEEEQ